MASKTIEEYLKTARPEQLAELKQDGQDLSRKHGIQIAKEGYQTKPATAPERADASDAKHSLASEKDLKSQESTRGADKIKQSMPTGEKAKAAEQGQEQQKSGVSHSSPAKTSTPDKGR